MATNFPDSPTTGEVFTSGGSSWKWDGTKWVAQSAVVAPSSALPIMDGTAAAGSATPYSREDHVHPSDTSRYATSNPAGYQTAGQVTASLGAYLPLAGGTLTGPLTLPADPTTALQAATKQYADKMLPLAGGTLTGDLTLAADPVNALDAATKQYVDTPVSSLWSNIRYRNRIINGDMAVDQRNNGSQIAAPTTPAYIIDRWKFGTTGIASKGTLGQAALGTAGIAATGLQLYFGWTTTTAYAVVAGDGIQFNQSIEGYNFNDANWGTANAQPVTLEFWAYATITGTYAGALRNGATNRSYAFTFTIAAASTWQKFRINIPGDTAGTWAVAGNAAAVLLNFSFGTGATFQTAPNVWTAGNFISATGAVNVVGTLNAGLFVTGVALMVGAAAANAEPEFRKYSDNLLDCQRYYQRYGGSIQGYSYATGAGLTLQYYLYSLITSMRATPTIVGAAFSNITNVTAGSGAMNCQPSGVIAQFSANAAGAFYAAATFTALDGDF